MKIKIEKTKKTTSTMEVELPYFTKSICHYYKVINDQKAIQVCDLNGSCSITIVHASLALESNETTERIFKKAYKSVSLKIQNLVES